MVCGFWTAQHQHDQESVRNWAVKALLDGRVRLGESQVRLAESKCWWKELRLHVGLSVSLTFLQEGCHSLALIAHVSIGEKIKRYLALISAHRDTITFTANVGAETDRICYRNIVIYILSNKLINIYLKSRYVFFHTFFSIDVFFHADMKNAIGFRQSLLYF